MFGFRPEGRMLTRGVDPITRLTPYIMTSRDDSQCYCTQYIDSDLIQEYVRKKRLEGVRISTMSVILAAYIRTISQFPALNRFVVGKTLYARRELCISFAQVKIKNKNEFLETVVKVYFDPHDTLFDVARKVDGAIERNKSVPVQNKTDRLVHTLLSIPGLVSVVVGFLKMLDRVGWMPRAIIDASPFHTSMFITNMASIGMNELHHHLYNFGTTTVFLGLGKKERRVNVSRGGEIGYKTCYPIAVVTDERVTPGWMYGAAFEYLKRMMEHPELLEAPPEDVKFDYNNAYEAKAEKIH